MRKDFEDYLKLSEQATPGSLTAMPNCVDGEFIAKSCEIGPEAVKLLKRIENYALLIGKNHDNPIKVASLAAQLRIEIDGENLF